jgi:hypothetical protein
MHLTEKQKSWLNAAALATAREGPVFKRETLRDWLKLALDESAAIAQFLQKEGLVVLLPTDEAILTDKGRQAVAAGSDVPSAPTDDPDNARDALGAWYVSWAPSPTLTLAWS